MLLSPRGFPSRSAIGPRNLPLSSSRLYRGYDKALSWRSEIEQIIKTAAPIGHRPSVQLGLQPRYPRPGLKKVRPRCDGLHQRLLRHAALLAVAPLASPEDKTCTASASTSRKSRCRPWPCARLSRTPRRVVTPATTTAAPPRTTGHQQTMCLPSRTLARVREGTHGRFPRSLIDRSTGEAPGSAPAASPAVTPQAFTVASLPAHASGPGVPRPRTGRRVRAAPSPYLPDLSWCTVRGLPSPMSLVHLPVSLAGPGPSGSTGPSRLCQPPGFSIGPLTGM